MMRRVILILLMVTLVAPAAASPATRVVEGDDVMYVGGTLPNIKPGTIGRLDLTRDHWATFQAGDARIEIPYKEIRSFHYAQRLAKRLGVIGTLAVVMVKHRRRRHFVEIAYNGGEDVAQVVLFEVSKEAALPVVAVLNARSPRPCAPLRMYPPNHPLYRERIPTELPANTTTACRIQTPPIYIPQ